MSSQEDRIGILTTDSELIVRSWDPWLERVTGIPAAEAQGQPLTGLVPDLEQRGLLARLERVLREGVVEVLAPTFHHYLIPCPPQPPSRYFDRMQQRVTLAPLREGENIVGTLVTIEDVTGRLEQERELAEQLASPDEATRVQAARRLAEEEVEDAEPALLEALADKSWRVRSQAVNGLVRRGGDRAVAALLRALREERHDLSVLNSAIQVLAMSNLDVMTPLIEFLRAPEADLRIYAALTLGERRDRRAAPALLNALADPDVNVRYHVIEALGRLRAAEAVDALLEIAEGRDFFLAFPALDALTQIGDPRAAPRIVPLLTDPLLRTAAAEALGQLGDEQAVAPLAQLLSQPDAPTAIIVQALVTLYDRYEARYEEGRYIADLTRRALQPVGVQNLLDALPAAHGDELRNLARVLGWLEGEAVERALTHLLGRPDARAEVVQALVRFGRRVTHLLLAQLAADDRETRQAAVMALGRIGDPQAVPALIDLLSGSSELMVATAGALARIGDRRAFEPLLALLGHPEAAVRQAAISALNSIGHPDMAAHIAQRLKDPNPWVRESAVQIAGYFGYANCLDQLFAACHDEDETVRRAALGSIAHLDDPRVAPTLQKALHDDRPRVRAVAARSLGLVEGREILSSLLGALQDPDLWVRYYAARSLGQHAFPEALDALVRLALDGEEVPMVRASAVWALGQIGGSRVAGTLAALLETTEKDIWQSALEALGQVGHPDALPPLLAAARSPDAERRLGAIQALAQRGGEGVAGALQWVAATDTEAAVSQAAIEALARLGTPEAVAALLSLAVDPRHREGCMAALAGMGVDTIEEVGRGLSHLHPAVRRVTVSALARMKHPKASALLTTVLNDEDASVRLEAVLALRRLGSRFAGPMLARLAHTDPDPEVRRAAQTALQP